MDMITLAMAKAYTDTQRLGYAETQKVVFFPHGVYEFTYDGMNTAQVPYENGDLIESFVGKELVVEFDGTMYKCQLKATGATHTVGNLAVLNYGEDTGEPFLILLTSDDIAMIVVYGNATTHTISVTTETETIHPIDPKYLPGVCLPVVELSTVPSNETQVLTEEEAARLEELFSSGTKYIFVSFLLSGYELNQILPCALTSTETESMYTGFIGTSMFIVGKADGQWFVEASA